MGVDHTMRIQDGNMRTGGIYEPLWFLIQILLGLVALWLIATATKPLQHWWKSLLIVGVQGAIGFGLYIIIGINYVCRTGIDCF